MPTDPTPDPALVELVEDAWLDATPCTHGVQLDYPEACSECAARAVLAALATEGRLRRTGPGSAYVQGDERPCGDPHPEGGLPCQLPPGHDSHARPASGGFDAWRPAPDEGRLLPGPLLAVHTNDGRVYHPSDVKFEVGPTTEMRETP